MDCSLPGSSVHRIVHARKLEWVAMPSSKESSWPRNGSRDSYVSCIGRWVLYHYHPGKPGMQGHKRVTVVAEGKKVLYGYQTGINLIFCGLLPES